MTIADYINNNTYGDLNATVSGNTVTVTGTLPATPSNADFLTFNIDEGVTVVWKATLSGTTISNFDLIYINGGSGTFQIESGSIENKDKGTAIRNNSACSVNVSGGTVSSTSGTAISELLTCPMKIKRLPI